MTKMRRIVEEVYVDLKFKTSPGHPRAPGSGGLKFSNPCPVITPLNMSSSATSSRRTSPVPLGHVWLIILHQEPSSFYLQIPVDTIRSLCLKPLKYLLFLGWCILGVEGTLALENNGNAILTDGDLDERGIYYYVMNAGTGMFLL